MPCRICDAYICVECTDNANPTGVTECEAVVLAEKIPAQPVLLNATTNRRNRVLAVRLSMAMPFAQHERLLYPTRPLVDDRRYVFKTNKQRFDTSRKLPQKEEKRGIYHIKESSLHF